MDNSKILVIGGYVTAMLDAARSRKKFTWAAQQTMINALIGIYGDADFEIESPPTQQANPLTESAQAAQEALVEAKIKKLMTEEQQSNKAQIGQTKREARN